MFQSGAQKQRGDCSEVSHLDVVVSPTVTVFQPWTLQVSAKFLLIPCPCFVSLPPGVNEELSEPLRERREAGAKEKDEARRDGKAESLLSHMVILLYQLSFSSLFNTFPSVMFLFSKCTLYWFDLMFGLISFSPLPFPALVSRLDKRPIDCIRCSETDIPIKAFKAEFLVCQSLHFILCSCLCWSLFHWFFTHLFLKQTVGHTAGKPHVTC